MPSVLIDLLGRLWPGGRPALETAIHIASFVRVRWRHTFSLAQGAMPDVLLRHKPPGFRLVDSHAGTPSI